MSSPCDWHRMMTTYPLGYCPDALKGSLPSEGEDESGAGVEQICALTFISPFGTFTMRSRVFGSENL